MAQLLNIHKLAHINQPVVLLSLEEYAALIERAAISTRGVGKSAKSCVKPSKKLLKFLARIRREKGPVFNSAKSFGKYLNNL